MSHTVKIDGLAACIAVAAIVSAATIAVAQQPAARPMSPQGSAQVQVLGSWAKGERPSFSLGRENYQNGK